MKTAGTLLFVIFFNSLLSGQSRNATFERAEILLASEQFGTALPLYLELWTKDSLNPGLNFKIGICYLNSRSQKTKAVYYLNKAIEPTSAYYSNGSEPGKSGTAVPQSVLAPTQLTYDFEKVNECSEKFRKLIAEVKDKELSVVEVLNLKLEIKKIGDELQQFNDSPINFKIETSSRKNSAAYVGYSSTISSDNKSLVFNFDKPGNKWEENNAEKMFFEEIPPLPTQNMEDTLGGIYKRDEIEKNAFLASTDTASGQKEANVAVSEDNQVLLTYRDDEGNGNLYISSLNGNTWTTPLKLNKIINTKGWETNECISEDGNWLYFTSNRKGGFGGDDIYRCKKLPNGEWSKASNLGPAINTAFDDRAPFILPGGHILYFSSNGRNVNNSFDIYTSTIDVDLNWSEPQKVGYPRIDPLETEKPTMVKTDKNGGDNFIFTFKNKGEHPLRIIKGNIVDSAGTELGKAKIKVVDNETGETVSFSNAGAGGKYSFILPAGKNKNVTYAAEGCLFQSENICPANNTKCHEKTNEIRMLPIAAGSRVILKNIFFEPQQPKLTDASKTELENLFHLLSDNPDLTIEISGYMTSKENAKSNKLISQQRAAAIEEYLLKKGIPEERIVSKGYVKYKPKTTVKKNTKAETTPQMATDWVELNVITKKQS